jgi:hypothetical protein
MDFGAKEVGQQQVSLEPGVGVSAAYDHAAEAEAGSHGGGDSGLIGLRGGPMDEDVTFLLHCLGHGILELADLVPPQGEACEVLPFDEDTGST